MAEVLTGSCPVLAGSCPDARGSERPQELPGQLEATRDPFGSKTARNWADMEPIGVIWHLSSGRLAPWSTDKPAPSTDNRLIFEAFAALATGLSKFVGIPGRYEPRFAGCWPGSHPEPARVSPGGAPAWVLETAWLSQIVSDGTRASSQLEGKKTRPLTPATAWLSQKWASKTALLGDPGRPGSSFARILAIARGVSPCFWRQHPVVEPNRPELPAELSPGSILPAPGCRYSAWLSQISDLEAKEAGPGRPRPDRSQEALFSSRKTCRRAPRGDARLSYRRRRAESCDPAGSPGICRTRSSCRLTRAELAGAQDPERRARS